MNQEVPTSAKDERNYLLSQVCFVSISQFEKNPSAKPNRQTSRPLENSVTRWSAGDAETDGRKARKAKGVEEEPVLTGETNETTLDRWTDSLLTSTSLSQVKTTYLTPIG